MKKMWKKKKWYDNPTEEDVFENFCNLFMFLTEEQREFLFELTERYLWIDSADYQNRFSQLLNKIDPTVITKCQTIYLFPIVKPADEGKVKSGSHCLYLLKPILSLDKSFRHLDVIVLDTFSDFNTTSFKSDGTELIFFIDDYIGSGESFEEMWLEVSTNRTLKKNFCYIISIVIQNNGFDYIFDTFDMPVLFSEKVFKGIDDNYNTADLPLKSKLMADIESNFRITQCNFGYKNSQSLVSMLATPDNTFPVYWTKYKKKGVEYFPPFPRNTLYGK